MLVKFLISKQDAKSGILYVFLNWIKKQNYFRTMACDVRQVDTAMEQFATAESEWENVTEITAQFKEEGETSPYEL